MSPLCQGAMPTVITCGNQQQITSQFYQSPNFCVVPTFSDESDFEEDEEYWSDSHQGDEGGEDAEMMDDNDTPADSLKTPKMAPTSTAQQQYQASLMKALGILSDPSVDVLDILAVMRVLHWDAHIQCIACEKLWVASWEDDAAIQLVDQGGIQVILEAMSRFPAYERLQQCACETLQNVAALEDEVDADECRVQEPRQQSPQAEICERGGVGLIVQAMMNYLHSPSLQQCGCATLSSLVADDPGNLAIIKAEGAVDAILLALRSHGNRHASVGVVACQALVALGFQDTAVEEMLC